jgi:hypothetical protein
MASRVQTPDVHENGNGAVFFRDVVRRDDKVDLHGVVEDLVMMILVVFEAVFPIPDGAIGESFRIPLHVAGDPVMVSVPELKTGNIFRRVSKQESFACMFIRVRLPSRRSSSNLVPSYSMPCCLKTGALILSQCLVASTCNVLHDAFEEEFKRLAWRWGVFPNSRPGPPLSISFSSGRSVFARRDRNQ